MNVVGISAHFHDAAACILVDGRLAAAAQKERFSRRKHYSIRSFHLTSPVTESSFPRQHPILEKASISAWSR